MDLPKAPLKFDSLLIFFKIPGISFNVINAILEYIDKFLMKPEETVNEIFQLTFSQWPWLQRKHQNLE